MEFVTYKKYTSADEAAYLVTLLALNKIEYRMEDIPAEVDLPAGSSEMEYKVEVKLKPEDFEIVEKLLSDEAIQDIDEVDKDYYLFEFTDEELTDIVINFDEWSPSDYNLAQKILKERGKEISKEKVDEYREKKLEILRKPLKGSQGWLIFGYISSLFGGFLGIFIGWSIITSRKTLPNGEVHHTYDEQTRTSGKNMFYLGVVAFIIWGVFGIIKLISE
jgi:hypothetical protein